MIDKLLLSDIFLYEILWWGALSFLFIWEVLSVYLKYKEMLNYFTVVVITEYVLRSRSSGQLSSELFNDKSDALPWL